MANLQFTASIDAAQFNKTLDDIEKKIKGLNSGGSVLSSIVETHDAIQALTAVADAIVKVRGEFRTWEGQMAGVLNSRVEANALMAEVMTMAGQSPLNVEEIAQGANALIAFGADAKTAMADLQMLGDVSLSVGVPLNELAELYGKMRESGAASSDELTKMAGKNIPVYEELARVLHTNTDEVKTFANEGKISFGQVQQAFMNMTNVGGIFHGVMQKEAETVAGQINALKNAFESMLNEIGQSQSGLLSMSVDGLSLLVEHYDKVEKILGVLVATYGAYRASIILAGIAQKAMAVGEYVNTIISLAKWVRNAKDAQILFNLVANENPYMLIATTVMAAVTAISFFSDETEKAASSADMLADANKKVQSEVSKQRNEITLLVGVLNNQNAAEAARLEAYEKIKEINPEILMGLDFQRAKTADLTKGVNEYIATLERKIRLEGTSEKLADAVDKESEKRQEILKAELELARLNNTPNNKFLNAYHETYAPNNNEDKKLKLEKSLESLKKEHSALLMNVIGLRENYTKVFNSTTEEGIKNEINELKILQNGWNKSSENYKNYQSEINRLNESLINNAQAAENLKPFSQRLAEANNYGALELLKSVKKTDKELTNYLKVIDSFKTKFKDKPEDYKKFSQLYDEVKLASKSKTNKASNNTPKAKNGKGNTNGDKETPKTFEQTLEEKKKQYQDYYKQINELGKASADLEFEELLKTGKSYKDFLDKQIADLEAKIKNNKGTDEDKQHLKKLQSESVKAYQSELDNKKIQYELYAKWQKEYGKEAADEQFKDLKDAGEGFKNYLKQEIAVLEAKIKSKTATADEKDKLIILKAKIELDPAALDAFKAQVTKMLQDAQSETEKISRLNNEKDVVGSTVTDDKEKAAKLKELDEQIDEFVKKRKELLDAFLSEYNLNEQKRVEIQTKYSNLRAALEAKYNDKTSADYLKTLNLLNEQEKENLENFDVQKVIKSSQGYKELQQMVIGSDEAVLKSRIESTKKLLKELSDGGQKNSEEYKKQLVGLIDQQEKLIASQIGYVSSLGGLLSGVKKEYGGIFSVINDIGNGLKQAAAFSEKILKINSQIKNRDIALENAKSIQEADKIRKESSKAIGMDIASIAVNLAMEVLNDIGNIIQENRQKTKAYYESIIAQQEYYLKLLNNEKRLKSQKDSFFSVDAFSSINDAMDARMESIGLFNKSIKVLEESGKAKDGTKLGFNRDKVGGGFLLGALGILKGIETQDKLVPLLSKFPKLYDKAIGGVQGFNKSLAESLIATNSLDEATKKQLQTVIDWVNQYEMAQKQLQESILSMTGQIGETLRDSLVNAFKEGQSSAEAFGNTVEKVLENIITQALYAQILKPVIDKLGNEIKASYELDKEGNLIGDGNIIDDIERFSDYGSKAAQEMYDLIGDAQQKFAAKGFELFKGTNPNSLSGSIKSVSEETAGVLAGQMNAIRMTQATNLDVNRNQLLALTEIATNSRFLKHLERLETIEKKISNNNGDIRAGGGY